jgi:beta-glucanase (GH16 family)
MGYAVVKARLRLGVLAIATVIGLILWGLIPGTKHMVTGGPHLTKAERQSLYESVASRPVDASTMRLAFDATFSGTHLDNKIWDTCYPTTTDPAKGCTNFNNPEFEWYEPSQVHVYGGALHIVATHVTTVGTNVRGSKATYECRSGMVTTHPGFNFKYGYVQIVAWVPNTPALWPALWLAASNLHWPPEIDLLEHWGPPRELTGAYFHPANAPRVVQRFKPGNLFDGWHTYSINWTRSQLTWYIDGQPILTVNQHVPQQKMYFIADLADYERTALGASACDGTMLVRSIKIWQNKTTA